jgi:hypothetical protein
LASRKHFDSGLEFRVLLADNLIKFGRAHSGFLQLFERSASLNALMLPRVADQQHTVMSSETGEKIAHLIGACEARFVHEIEMSLLCERRSSRPSEESLQGSGIYARLAKLARGAGSWGEALDLKPLNLGGTANDGKRRRLTGAGQSLHALDAVRGTQYILDHAPLSAVQMLVLVGKCYGLRPWLQGVDLVSAVSNMAHDFELGGNSFGRCELATGHVRPFYSLKFS